MKEVMKDVTTAFLVLLSFLFLVELVLFLLINVVGKLLFF